MIRPLAPYRWLAVLAALALASACHDTKKSPKPAANWVLITNVGGSISLLDVQTGLTHGPYLQGQLGGVNDQLLDAAVTPDGRTAILSSFGGSRLFFVDLADLAAPALLGQLELPMFAEDVTLTADGGFAIVTDGGFSRKTVVVDVASRTIADVATHPDVYTCASAVGRDGTVVTANYFAPGSLDPYGKLDAVAGGYLTTWTIDANGHMTHANDYALYLRASGEPAASTKAHALRPVNVAVAPDRVTVLVPDVGAYNTEATTSDPEGDYSAGMAQYAVAVYRITAPGVLTFQRVIAGLPRAAQSIAFSADGREAYLLGNNGVDYDEAREETRTADHLLVLDITGPGEVSYDPTRSANLGHTSQSQLFGVDNLVVLRGMAIASYSTASVFDAETNPLRVVSMVDLETLEVTRIPAGLAPDGLVASLAVVPRTLASEPPAGAGSCAGVCGTADRAGACFCDLACQDFGDCCADYEALCTDCDPEACPAGQACVNQAGDGGTSTYACGCGPGWEDDGAGGCVNVDECTAGTASCKPGATCDDYDGGYACECPSGLTPDGSGGCLCAWGYRDDGAGGCVDVDECTELTALCQAPATCGNTPGSYECTCVAPLESDGLYGCVCPSGTESDGAGGCLDVDQCTRGLHACTGDATCTNVVDGWYTCDCASPLVPDGLGGCLLPPPP